MTLSRICNRIFMNYCVAMVNHSELRGWYFDAMFLLHKIEDAQKR